MKRTNTYINQFSSLNLRTPFRERVSSFIEQHAGVFQALSRQGTPYGGNWMPATQPDSLQPMKLTAESMVEVERELDAIILRLSQLTNSLGQSAGETKSQTGNRAGGRAKEIGLERFHALQVEA